jgi:hypothetical protein
MPVVGGRWGAANTPATGVLTPVQLKESEVRTSRSLTRVRLAAFAAAAAMALAGVLLSTSAATAAPTPSHRAVVKAPVVTWRLVKTSRIDPANAAGDPCTTITETEEGLDSVHVELFWARLTTYFCWNGSLYGPWNAATLVTSHKTDPTVGVTGTGTFYGWNYVQNITGVQFHCFVTDSHWSGGINKCSGNYENDEFEFQACELHIGCYDSAYPWVQQQEYLNGDFWQGGGFDD